MPISLRCYLLLVASEVAPKRGPRPSSHTCLQSPLHPPPRACAAGSRRPGGGASPPAPASLAAGLGFEALLRPRPFEGLPVQGAPKSCLGLAPPSHPTTGRPHPLSFRPGCEPSATQPRPHLRADHTQPGPHLGGWSHLHGPHLGAGHTWQPWEHCCTLEESSASSCP